MAKSGFLQQKFLGIQVWILLVVLILIVGTYGYHKGWFDREQTIIQGPSGSMNEKLKLDILTFGMTFNNTAVANANQNYNSDSRVAAVQLNAQRNFNGTHTVFSFTNGSTVYESKSFGGELSKPPQSVTLPVEVTVGLEYVSGFTNVNDVLTSSVTVSAPAGMKKANGSLYYPLVMKDGKPAVYIDNKLTTAKNLQWRFDETNQYVVISFDLDWEGVDQMISISDEVQVSLLFTNIQSGQQDTIKIRIIKNSAI